VYNNTQERLLDQLLAKYLRHEAINEASQLMMSETSRAKAKALGNQGLDVRLEGLLPPKQALRHARHTQLTPAVAVLSWKPESQRQARILWRREDMYQGARLRRL
jgi:hypothetical protein